MREKGKDFFPFTCEQYNFFDEPTRLFFMKAKMKGIIVPGYHRYSDANALMDIRLFGFFTVVKKEGKDMDQAETVTLFNDMCMMAPATLIDFISNDRDINNIPFFTPVSNYKNINGINIMTHGEAIWHYPEGKFVYGKFNLKEVEYNVSTLK